MRRAQASSSSGGNKQLDKVLLDLIIKLLLAASAPSVVQPALTCLLAIVAVTPSHSRAAFAPLMTSGRTALLVCKLLYSPWQSHLHTAEQLLLLWPPQVVQHFLYADFCVEYALQVMSAMQDWAVCKLVFQMGPAGHVSNVRLGCTLPAVNDSRPLCIKHADTDRCACGCLTSFQWVWL